MTHAPGVLWFQGPGVAVRNQQASIDAIAKARADEHLQPRPEHDTVILAAYAILSGFVAVVVGAAISLAVPAQQRIPWWTVATGVVAITAGIAHESKAFRTSRLVCRRWLHRL
jgi:protein-S-isoprenylcysteine O-methyltransferase Ste14